MKKRPPSKITPRELDVLAAFAREIQAGHPRPTFEAVGQALGMSKVSAWHHAQALIEKGFLERLEGGVGARRDVQPSRAGWREFRRRERVAAR